MTGIHSSKGIDIIGDTRSIHTSRSSTSDEDMEEPIGGYDTILMDVVMGGDDVRLMDLEMGQFDDLVQDISGRLDVSLGRDGFDIHTIDINSMR